jgi:hypothetical protein
MASLTSLRRKRAECGKTIVAEKNGVEILVYLEAGKFAILSSVPHSSGVISGYSILF